MDKPPYLNTLFVQNDNRDVCFNMFQLCMSKFERTLSARVSKDTDTPSNSVDSSPVPAPKWYSIALSKVVQANFVSSGRTKLKSFCHATDTGGGKGCENHEA